MNHQTDGEANSWITRITRMSAGRFSKFKVNAFKGNSKCIITNYLDLLLLIAIHEHLITDTFESVKNVSGNSIKSNQFSARAAIHVKSLKKTLLKVPCE